MEQAQNKLLFALLRNELYQTEIESEIKALITPEVIEGLFRLAKKHDLAHLISDALFKNGLLVKDMVGANAFLRQQQTAIFRYESLRFELEEICKVLEEERIAYMPLKGSVLREYYPEPWMRTSCDIDVYVQKENLEKAMQALVQKLQYKEGERSACDISLYAPSGVHLELHFELLEEHVNAVAAKRLEEVWTTSVPVSEGSYQRKATPELFVFYHLVHTAKHFIGGGCGIRPFIDLSVIERYMPYDREVLYTLLQECNFLAFAQKAEKLSKVWLSGEEHDETTSLMQAYLLDGGTYGSMENHIKVSLGKKKSKLGYILSRIFLPYRELKLVHPTLEKHLILYPFFTVKRWLNLLFVRGRAKRSLQELGKVTGAQGDEAVEKLFDELQLNE